MTARALADRRRLDAALAYECRSTPCRTDPDAFTDYGQGSNHRRPRAARLCLGCPVLDLCNAYAESAGEEPRLGRRRPGDTTCLNYEEWPRRVASAPQKGHPLVAQINATVVRRSYGAGRCSQARRHPNAPHLPFRSADTSSGEGHPGKRVQ